MSINLEQGRFGRFYIEYEGPAGHTRFTYLLGDNTCLGEHHLNGTSPKDPNDRVLLPETSDHRQILSNFRSTLEQLKRIELLDELPTCDEPLIIYQQTAVDK